MEWYESSYLKIQYYSIIFIYGMIEIVNISVLRNDYDLRILNMLWVNKCLKNNDFDVPISLDLLDGMRSDVI